MADARRGTTGAASRGSRPRSSRTRTQRAGQHPLQAGRHAKAALKIARPLGDPDLEITALGRLGLAEVRVGAVESGMSRFDEAMAAALGGEASELETLGELCCALIAAWARAELHLARGEPAAGQLYSSVGCARSGCRIFLR